MYYEPSLIHPRPLPVLVVPPPPPPTGPFPAGGHDWPDSDRHVLRRRRWLRGAGAGDAGARPHEPPAERGGGGGRWLPQLPGALGQLRHAAEPAGVRARAVLRGVSSAWRCLAAFTSPLPPICLLPFSLDFANCSKLCSEFRTLVCCRGNRPGWCSFGMRAAARALIVPAEIRFRPRDPSRLCTRYKQNPRW